MTISDDEREALKEELREEVRADVLDDLGPRRRSRSRRDVLKMGGAAVAGGVLGGAGSASAGVGPGGETLDVGGVTASTYRIADNWYGGPASARSELVGELDADDTGARFGADDTGDWYYWNGSAWDLLPGGGGSGGFDAAVTKTLVGSADPLTPSSDLDAEIVSGLSNGYRRFDVIGAWTWDSDVTFSSADYVPFGVTIDARDAYIEYAGSGTMLTNDNSGGRIVEQRDGGTLNVIDGYWQATGAPSAGFVFRDGTFNHIDVRMQGWENAGNCSCIVFEAVDTWCESNYISPETYLCDTTLEGLDTRNPTSKNTSFQDNYVDDLHAGAVQNGAAIMKLQGNWIDCTFVNPTGITGSADAALFEMQANMRNSSIISPEMEDGASGVVHYLVRLTPDSRAGPVQYGGWIRSTDDVIRFDVSQGRGSYKWFVLSGTGDGDVFLTRFAAAGQIMQTGISGGGSDVLAADTDENGTFSLINRVRPSGDVDLQTQGTIRDPVNSTTADSMTADPETATEDGYMEVRVGGTDYQVPLYAP